MEEKHNLYDTHVFICESCSYQKDDGEMDINVAMKFRKEIKALCKSKIPTTKIRINGAQCLGHCERGINAVIYPEGLWCHDLRDGDQEALTSKIIDLHFRREAQKA